MTDLSPASAEGAPLWTCPFCPVLCDGSGTPSAQGLVGTALARTQCSKARAALDALSNTAAPVTPWVDGQPATLDAAVAAAAAVLSASRQPLFGGLGTDVAGARALYRLACITRAICDAAKGEALMQGLRALQDRGRFTTTLAEVKERADLVVCVGGRPEAPYERFFARCGWADDDPRIATLEPPPGQSLFGTVALLAAAVEGRAVNGELPAGMAELRDRLLSARYAVLVYETARLPAHGALVIEALQRVVGTLNRSTRAASMALGGGDGASTVNDVFTWLSGLPLRTRASPLGLEHEPLRHGAQRLLDDRAVDALLWVSTFNDLALPAEAATVPRIVLGAPTMAAAAKDATVFIPVSTPGIGSAGHVFRVDGSVMLPLWPLVDDGLPTVHAIARRLADAVQTARPAKETA